MCSKLLRAFIVFALTALNIGCGVHLFEPAPKDKPILYRGQGYACVSQIPKHFEMYINDELKPGEITEFTTCLQRALSSFMALTNDRHQSSYKPDHIRDFLQEYFLKDRPISNELVLQFMKIKQALVGGSLDLITREDLTGTIALLEDIRVETIRLKPYLPYLNSALLVKQPKESLGEHMREANLALNHAIDVFAGKLRNSKRAYSFDDLAVFMREIRTFVNWKDHFKDAHPEEQWVALLKVFKQIAVSPKNPDKITSDEWTPLFTSGARWYLSYLVYAAGIKGANLTFGAGLQNLVLFGNQTFALMEEAISHQPSATVTNDQMDGLFHALHDIGWIPSYIRVESLNQFFAALTKRFFGDPHVAPDFRTSMGLTAANVAAMRSEFERWYYVQLDLEHTFNPEQNPSDFAQPRVVTPQLKLMDNMPTIAGEAVGSQSSYYRDFLNVEQIRPLFATGLPRVMLVPQSKIKGNLGFTFYDLSAKNILRSAVQVLFNGYAEDNKWFWTSGISQAEMQKFYTDVKNLGIDLQIVDRRNDNSGSRAFVEGKLFTYSSKGYDPSKPGLGTELSSQETMTYLAYLFSGSSEATQIFDWVAGQDKGVNRCAHGPVKDQNGVDKIDRKCVIAHMPELMNMYMQNMPNMLSQYLNVVSEQERMEFVADAVDSAYAEGTSDPTYIEKSELTTVAVVLHYVESVMTFYDTKPQDDILTNEELEPALDTFRGFVRKVAADQASAKMWGACDHTLIDRLGALCTTKWWVDFVMDDDNANGAVFYILKYGSIPTVMDYLRIKQFSHPSFRPQLHMNRGDLMRTFKSIIKELLKSSKAAAPGAAH